MFHAEVEKDDRKTKKYQLNFFLEMSRIGELHCQLMVDDAIQGCFFCASREVSRHLGNSLVELKEILMGLGYQQVKLSCQPADLSLRMKLQERLEEQAGRAAVSLVDIKA